MNLFFAFIVEIFKRIGSKTPLFFKVIAWIGFIAMSITGLPDFLAQFHIIVPAAWQSLESHVVAVAGAVAGFVSLLATQGGLNVNPNGVITTDSDPKKLPFTTQVQQKQIEANGAAKK